MNAKIIPSVRQLMLLALLVLLLTGCNQEPAPEAPTPDPEQAKASIMALAGTAWQLDFIGEPEAGLTAIEDSRSTLNFSVVNYLGSGGCNWYQGVYEASEPSIQLNPPFQTRLSCSEPPGIMDQEGTFNGALTEATDYVLEEDKLVLYMNGTEQRLATFSPAEHVEFESTLWGLKLYYDGQAWFPVIPQTEVLAQFVDGKLSGTAGCNDYEASYQVDGQRLAIADLTAGQESCSDPVEIMEQESIYLSALEMAAGYEILGGMLTVLDGNGKPILYFGVQ